MNKILFAVLHKLHKGFVLNAQFSYLKTVQHNEHPYFASEMVCIFIQ